MGIIDETAVTVAVERMTTTGYKQDYASVGSEAGSLQPLSDTMAPFVSGNFEKSHLLISPTNTIIKVGDKLTINSEYYIVTGEKSYELLDLKHTEFIIEEKNV